MITQARLKELLHYDPLTGIFTNKVRRGTKGRVGGNPGTMNNSGYLAATIDGWPYLIHRLAYLYMEGSFPADQIDHIDRNKLNNIWENLRPATATINGRNRPMNENNTSGFNGVHWLVRDRKWRAQTKVNYKTVYLGTFCTRREAIKARKAADIKYGFSENHGRAK